MIRTRYFPASGVTPRQAMEIAAAAFEDMSDVVDRCIRIVVEADGHDLHDRTKAQVARDKKRDRDMVAEGWRVLRFTGSEINGNARACANEVAQTMYQLEQEVFR